MKHLRAWSAADVLIVALGLALLVVMGGCYFSPFPDGQGGVFGVKVNGDGSVSAINEGWALLGPLIGVAGMGTLGGGGIAIAKGIRAVIDRAHLQGESKGWTDREAAAQVQAPMVGSPITATSAAPVVSAMPTVGGVSGGVQPVSGTNAAGGVTPSIPVVELPASPKAAKKPRKGKSK